MMTVTDRETVLAQRNGSARRGEMLADRAEAMNESGKKGSLFNRNAIAGVAILGIGIGYTYLQTTTPATSQQTITVPEGPEMYTPAPSGSGEDQLFNAYPTVPRGPSASELQMQQMLQQMQAMQQQMLEMSGRPAGIDPATKAHLDAMQQQNKMLEGLVTKSLQAAETERSEGQRRRGQIENEIATLKAELAAARAGIGSENPVDRESLAHAREMQLLRLQAELDMQKDDRAFSREQSTFELHHGADKEIRILESRLEGGGDGGVGDQSFELERLRLEAQLNENQAAAQFQRDRELRLLEADLAQREADKNRLLKQRELDNQLASSARERLIADTEAEKARTAALREKEKERRNSAGVIFENGRSSGSGVNSFTSEGPQTQTAALSGKQRFLKTAAEAGVTTVEATYLPNPDRLIAQGTFIPGVLETAINSDLPGGIRAVVTDDVWSADGSQVLIPKGSRLVGQYQSSINLGQRRLLIAWNRALTPDHRSVMLGSTGTDALGRGGITGHVDTHFGTKFEAALITSVIVGLSSAGSQRVVNEVAGVRDGAEAGNSAISEAAGSAVSDYLEIPPTINVDQGTTIQVFVQRDLYL